MSTDATFVEHQMMCLDIGKYWARHSELNMAQLLVKLQEEAKLRASTTNTDNITDDVFIDVMLEYTPNPQHFMYNVTDISEEDDDMVIDVRTSRYNEHDFREFAQDMLNSFYECNSIYGNPIDDIISYIPTKDLVELVETYHYKVEVESV